MAVLNLNVNGRIHTVDVSFGGSMEGLSRETSPRRWAARSKVVLAASPLSVRTIWRPGLKTIRSLITTWCSLQKLKSAPFFHIVSAIAAIFRARQRHLGAHPGLLESLQVAATGVGVAPAAAPTNSFIRRLPFRFSPLVQIGFRRRTTRPVSSSYSGSRA